MNSVQKPGAPQAQMLNRMTGGQQLGSQISTAFQNSPMGTVFGPIFDRAGSAVNDAFAPLTQAIQNRQTQPAPTYSQPSMPMMGLPSTTPNTAPQYQNTMRALWGRR